MVNSWIDRGDRNSELGHDHFDPLHAHLIFFDPWNDWPNGENLRG